jgi:hypothetical protein
VSRRTSRLVTAVVIAAAAGALLSVRPLGTTFAVFNGETENAGSAFALNWVTAPSGASAIQSSDDVDLRWTVGHGTAQELDIVDNGSNSDCDGVDYSSGDTVSLGAGDDSYTDTDRAVGHAGDLICYAIVSTVATWRAQTTVSVQLSP